MDSNRICLDLEDIMNNSLIKDYIDTNPVKVVSKLDFDKEKLEYDKINQLQKRTDAKPEELCRAYLLTKLARACSHKYLQTSLKSV